MKKKIRPSSASAKLQTHSTFSTAFINNTNKISNEHDFSSFLPKRPHTQATGPRRTWQSERKERSQVDIVVAKRPRRLTLGTVEGIAGDESIIRPVFLHQHRINHPGNKIENCISIDTLTALQRAFASVGTIELDEFKQLLKKESNLTSEKDHQISCLFMKIDWASTGHITWNEFCTYMQLEYAEKDDSCLRAKEVVLNTPARISNIPHRDAVLRMTDSSDGNFMACSQEGIITFWSVTADLKRLKSVVNIENVARSKPKWITDFVLMTQFNKVIIGTGDREIQFFELSSLEPYCQIGGLETVPFKLDYSSTATDECLILYGDTQGCVNILTMERVGECLRIWKKMPKQDGYIASVSIEAVTSNPHVQLIRWQVHGDWVQQIKYYHDLGQVISCCNDFNTAMVIGSVTGSTHVEQQLKELSDAAQLEKTHARQMYGCGVAKWRMAADQVVFKVYKGVRCFDFSKTNNIIVTGGMDRIIRLWNPYVSGKPTALFRGHSAPIFFLHVAEDDNRVYSMSTERIIKVWDIQEHTCLLSVRPKSHKIRGDLQAVHYSSISKAIAVATDHMSVLCLRQKTCPYGDTVITHNDPVTCCKYNASMQQVVTCCSSSIVKLWDLETGTAIFEYGNSHGKSAITCMMFDSTMRRLITGGRDGTLKIWNYNNGHCLHILKPVEEHEFSEQDSNQLEVCDLTYVEMNKNKYIISVGWDRRINIYHDPVSESSVHYIQHPLLHWADDEHSGHKEDILAVAHCLPNLLATSSYDGEVIVWNMVSGHIFTHLRPAPPDRHVNQSLDGDLSICKLLFLSTRACVRDAGSLLASGPYSHIHVWKVFQGSCLMAHFPGCNVSGGVVTVMSTNSANTLLYTGDSLGFMRVWFIANYCVKSPESEPPEVLCSWRAHAERISSLDLVEQRKVLLTSSNDRTVRLWTTDGHYIGTFGQPNLWDIYDVATYQHPMVPYDVLVDPLSLPAYPVCAGKNQTSLEAHGHDIEPQSVPVELSPSSPPPFHNITPDMINDRQIADMLQDWSFDKPLGKRLRHERNRRRKVEWSGPSEYQMLDWYELDETPELTPPHFKVIKHNSHDFHNH